MKITKRTLYGKVWGQRIMSLDEVAAQVKYERTKQLVEAFRKRWEMSLSSQREGLDRKMPRLLFGGAFCKEGMKAYSGYVLLEVERLQTQEEAESLKRKIAAYPQVLFAMTGADGRSVKFVVPYTRPDGSLPQTEEEAALFHAHAFRHALKTFEPRLGCSIELRKPDVRQSCLLSYDPDVHYNPQAFAIHLEQPLSMPEESLYQERHEKISSAEGSGKSLYDRYRYVSIQYELALRRTLERYGDLDGNPDLKPVLVCLSGLCFDAGIGEEDCVRWTALYLGTLLGEVEIRETVGNVYGMREGAGSRPVCKPEQIQALKMEEFMTRRYEFRFNTMTGAPEYRERNSFCFSFRPLTERVLNSIALNAQQEGLMLWDRDVRRYVYSDRLTDYAPIEGYLKNLPEWDGEDRIRALAARIPCGNPHWEQLFYTWFLSMVAHYSLIIFSRTLFY